MRPLLVTTTAHRSAPRSQIKKTVSGIAATVLGAVAITGCNPAEFRQSLASCTPSYNPHSGFGSFSVQQRGPGAPIQYGIYPSPKSAGTYYYLVVTISGKRKPYDVKRQDYPPHGSVDAPTVRRYEGHTLTLAGTVSRDGKLRLTYQLNCKVA